MNTPSRFIKNIPILLLFLLAACRPQAPDPTPTQAAAETPEATATLAEAGIATTRPPAPETTVRAYFDAWVEDDFAGMYALLSEADRSSMAEEEFTRRYIDALAMAAVDTGQIEVELLETMLHPDSAEVRYHIVWHSNLFGDIERENRMSLTLNGGSWSVAWSDGLILPEMAGGNVLRRLYYPPADRGDIYDMSGSPLVAFSDAYAVGIVPARIDPDTEPDMLSSLGRATGLPPEFLFWLYQDVGYDYDLYLPVTDVAAEDFNRYYNSATSFDAVSISAFSSRYYLGSGDAAQILGFTSFVQPEEQDEQMRQGMWWTSRIARAGVELWGNDSLAGGQGGALFLDDPSGNEIDKLGETFVQPASDIYLTIDKDLQRAAQQALFGLTGAVVVMEQDSGRILAMASSPTYSPNLFDPENTNSLFTSPFTQPGNPTLNRAINGQYPLGSVFKIITMAAALETGEFSVDDTYDCGYSFDELLPLGPVLYDWTWERNQKNLAEGKDPFPPSGVLTLPEGLMRSCNPWFYHIGLSLFDDGLTTALSDMARGFGLGSPTGLIGIPGESSGQVLDPGEKLDATNLATGQGELLVTPLQVANFVTAVANGGSFYVPQLVESVVDPDGNTLYEFTPRVSGQLPISDGTLSEIRAAMELVTQNPRGTAEYVFRNFAVDLAGKTGTAQSGGFNLDPHAWFVAFTEENREDLPDVVVVVLIENQGEGSEWAAPVARRVLENYFFNRSIRGYPWEIRLGVPEWLAFPEPQEGG